MWKLEDLIERCNSVTVYLYGQWVPARPRPYAGLTGFKKRLQAAWAVLTGKAEAFTWPGGQ